MRRSSTDMLSRTADGLRDLYRASYRASYAPPELISQQSSFLASTPITARFRFTPRLETGRGLERALDSESIKSSRLTPQYVAMN